MKNAMKALSLACCLLGLSNTAGAVTQECMDFESFSTGVQFPVGTDYSYSDIYGELVAFQWDDGTWDFGGHAEVVNSNYAYGTGQESNLNNINLRYIFSVTQPYVATFRYGDHGGNVNLGINGILNNTQDLSDLDGMIVGGVFVMVTRQNEPGPGNNHHGIVTLIGEIEKFGVGGQEFWVDDVCAYFQ